MKPTALFTFFMIFLMVQLMRRFNNINLELDIIWSDQHLSFLLISGACKSSCREWWSRTRKTRNTRYWHKKKMFKYYDCKQLLLTWTSLRHLVFGCCKLCNIQLTIKFLIWVYRGHKHYNSIGTYVYTKRRVLKKCITLQPHMIIDTAHINFKTNASKWVMVPWQTKNCTSVPQLLLH